MTTLTKALKKMLNAMAFADAGEHLTPGKKTEYLNRAKGISATPAQVETLVSDSGMIKASGTSRRVALYIGSELPAEMMDYVLQTCVRLKHGLTVLSFQPESASRILLAPYQEALASAGIDMQLVKLNGDSIPALARYLRSHPEIAFLACKETGYLGRSFLTGTQSQNALPVPVVLLETQTHGSRELTDVQPNRAKNAKASVA